MKSKITNYVRAGYPGPYLLSSEEQRVALEMTRIAQELKYNLVFWSVVDGLVDTQKGTSNSANDPLEALIAINSPIIPVWFWSRRHRQSCQLRKARTSSPQVARLYWDLMTKPAWRS